MAILLFGFEPVVNAVTVPAAGGAGKGSSTANECGMRIAECGTDINGKRKSGGNVHVRRPARHANTGG